MYLKGDIDKIEINSYRDCIWYIDDIDRCKLPGAKEKFSVCHCKDDIDDFCVWVTKFLKSSNSSNELTTMMYIGLDIDNIPDQFGVPWNVSNSKTPKVNKKKRLFSKLLNILHKKRS